MDHIKPTHFRHRSASNSNYQAPIVGPAYLAPLQLSRLPEENAERRMVDLLALPSDTIEYSQNVNQTLAFVLALSGVLHQPKTNQRV
jgi:hypothetical protein